MASHGQMDTSSSSPHIFLSVVSFLPPASDQGGAIYLAESGAAASASGDYLNSVKAGVLRQ
uniref:Uncharacterized protein n=1 Tax=Leersia perrieri TaxID=77586 RepID=A0A0D9WCT9_9ORYZ